ncbi:MAG: hypothetical protein GKS01_14660 [Alphaproteobacteria bacterium]|nr:hypothetical protein [Alphaproteobacteria bacterium]
MKMDNSLVINESAQSEDWRRQTTRILRRSLVAFSLFGVSGCVTLDQLKDSVVNSKDTGDTATTKLPTSEAKSLSIKGVEALRKNQLKKASILFNQALKLDIQNSYLQLLNGMAYHMQAIRSDTTQFALAHQGYNLAIKFDPSNWIARYQLGLLHRDQRRFDLAKEAFADALFYKDDDTDILYNLAVSSYYTGDPETAAGALKRLRELEPNSPRTLQASSLVSAALGRARESSRFLDDYKRTKPRQNRFVHLTRRLGDWQKVHARVQKASFRSPFPKARRNAQLQLTQSPFGDSSSSSDSSSDTSSSDSGQSSDGSDSASSEKMVVVDVVIISSREDITTAKGINLLNGLTLQFSGSRAVVDGVTQENLAETTSFVTTLTKTITLPSITYSLNIMNSGATRNEILARPSLVAISGQKSEFFSGENIKAATVSTSAAESTATIDSDIGVKLGVTPTFLADGRVKLLVGVERTFLTSTSSNVTYTNQIRTTKESVNANVLMNHGETLILSGLSEKETENVRSGVPGIQDVPGLQYLFSNQTTRDFNKSVLVLLTPRIPEYTYRPRKIREKEAAKAKDGGRILNELKARYTDWFRPYPNWASVFRHLQDNSLYRQFRTGDVALERWDTQSTHEGRLKKALEFLLY